jgi:ketosteroid isomerase-like protein
MLVFNRLLISIVLFASPFYAVAQDESSVTSAVESFRIAMINADSSGLARILSPKLSYGHSSGLVESRGELLQKISSGVSDFVTMELSEQTVIVSGKTAIVRHTLKANINDNGKAAAINLKVILVWEKHNKNWRLLARQAVKVP